MDENLNNEPISLIDFAKANKESCVDILSNQKGMPPTVVVEKNNEILAVISSPEQDSSKALSIAAFSRIGFEPDFLTYMFDSRVAIGKVSKDIKDGEITKEVVEKIAEEIKSKVISGNYEGAKYLDCIICIKVDKEANSNILFVPYEQTDNSIKWLQSEELQKFQENVNLEQQMSGPILQSLKNIMIDKIDEKKKAVAEKIKFNSEKEKFHCARAIMSILSNQNCFVRDYFTIKNLQFVNYKKKSSQLLNSFVKENMPREAFQQISEVVDKHLGNEEFVQILKDLLLKNRFWMPAELRDDNKIEEIAVSFENICFSPGEEDLKFVNKILTRNGLRRVRVWNGDQSEYLGEGVYTQDVTLYFFKNKDGEIVENKDPELQLNEIDCPEGGRIVSIKSPKIIMDSYSVVYGCQSWWEDYEIPLDDNDEKEE